MNPCAAAWASSQDPPLEVDSNLRPEGRNGALVRTLASYKRYYSEWGETWELQALLRATWIAGDKNLGMRFLRMIDQFRYPAGGATAKQVSEVRRMKARVDSERLPKGADKNLHTKLGRGGLTDVEWTAQLLTMQHCDKEHLRNTSTLGVLKEMAGEELISEADARRCGRRGSPPRRLARSLWSAASARTSCRSAAAGPGRSGGRLAHRGVPGVPGRLPEEDAPGAQGRRPGVLG